MAFERRFGFRLLTIAGLLFFAYFNSSSFQFILPCPVSPETAKAYTSVRPARFRTDSKTKGEIRSMRLSGVGLNVVVVVLSPDLDGGPAAVLGHVG